MNYDEIIEGSRRVTAPPLESEVHGTGAGGASESIISALKTVDRRTRVSIRVLQGIFAFLILLAVGFIIINGNAVVRSGVGFLILSFVLVIYMQQLRFKVYSQTYLDGPMIEHLRQAKKRMRVFTVRSWIAVPAWLAIDAGLCLLVYAASHWIGVRAGYVILALQVPIVMAAAADFLVEYLIWKREHKPTVTRIDEILNDIESSLVSNG